MTESDLFKGSLKDSVSHDRDVAPSYGSIAWRWLRDPETELVKVTLGWSMPLGNGQDYATGSRSYKTRFPDCRMYDDHAVPFVEEPLGVMQQIPSLQEIEWNEHFERIVADYLLLFVHWALFGQCRQVWGRVPGGRPTVDCVLVLGPTLPKFRGRICYSHFHRDKTVAIIAPSTPVGRGPAQGVGSWSSSPAPTYWHDRAARRWFLEPAPGASSDERRVSSFEVLIPTGDGISGQLPDQLALGAKLWQTKANLIQRILDTERESVRLACWQNVETTLPRGMARALRRAVLDETMPIVIERVRRREPKWGDATFQKGLRLQIEKLNLECPREELPGLKDLVFARALEIAEGETVRASQSRARRAPNQAVDKALAAIREEIGEYVFTR